MGKFYQRIKAWVAVDSFFQSLARLTLVAVSAGVLLWVVAAMTGDLINRPPKNGEAAFKKLDIPKQYSLRSESVRQFRLDDQHTYQIARITRAVVDRDAGKYQLDARGYNVYTSKTFYDGKTFIEGGDGELYKQIDQAPSMREISGPTKEELQKMSPSLVSNDSTYGGTNKRAWVVQFKPTCQDLYMWMMWEGMRPYTRFYIPDMEKEVMTKEKCEVEYAYMFIDHESHHPALIDVKFKINDEIGYHYLWKYSGFGTNLVAKLTNSQNPDVGAQE